MASKKKAASKKGRPPKYATPEAFAAAVEEYRDHCRENKEPITLTGMLLHIGLSSRQSLSDYEQKPGFTGPVKRARLLVEAAYERRLTGSAAGGAIFALKNMGWSDKQEHEMTGKDGEPLHMQTVVILPAKHAGD